MSDLDIIKNHIIIQDTIGYDIFNTIEICDIPTVLEFLKITYNYIKIL